MASSHLVQINDPEAMKLWDTQVEVQLARKTCLMDPTKGFIQSEKKGKGRSVVVRKDELWKGSGTRATATLVHQLNSPPRGNQRIYDQEESQKTSTFTWDIGLVRHATSVRGLTVEQRLPFNVVANATGMISDWWRVVFEAGAMMQLAGFGVAADRTREWWLRGDRLPSTWHNAPKAPVGEDHISLNDGNAEDLKPSHAIDTGILGHLVATAQTKRLPIAKANVYGDEYFVLFVHPWTIAHWTKSRAQWWTEAKAMIQGGELNGHPIATGTVGVYDETVIVRNPYLPPAIHSDGVTPVANTRRAVFCGASALLYGAAQNYDGDRSFRMVMSKKDYGQEVGVEGHTFGGMTVPTYDLDDDGTDWRGGSIVVDCYTKDLLPT